MILCQRIPHVILCAAIIMASDAPHPEPCAHVHSVTRSTSCVVLAGPQLRSENDSMG